MYAVNSLQALFVLIYRINLAVALLYNIAVRGIVVLFPVAICVYIAMCKEFSNLPGTTVATLQPSTFHILVASFQFNNLLDIRHHTTYSDMSFLSRKSLPFLLP